MANVESVAMSTLDDQSTRHEGLVTSYVNHETPLDAKHEDGYLKAVIQPQQEMTNAQQNKENHDGEAAGTFGTPEPKYLYSYARTQPHRKGGQTAVKAAVDLATGAPIPPPTMTNAVSPDSPQGSDANAGEDKAISPTTTTTPLPSRPISYYQDDSGYRRSEHIYSNIPDSQFHDADAQKVTPERSNQAVVLCTADEYEKLYLNRREPHRLNWKPLPYVLTAFASIVIVVILWVVNEQGWLTSQADIMPTDDLSPTRFEYPDIQEVTRGMGFPTLDITISRAYVGGNATLVWHIPNIDLRSHFICQNDRDVEIVHLMNMSLVNLTTSEQNIGGDIQKKMKLIFEKEANIFGFTLFNVSMHDAGEYVCWRAEGEEKTGTLFIWDEPSAAKIKQNGLGMTCEVHSSSQPESARPNMTYVWFKDGSRLVGKPGAHLTVPTELQQGSTPTYSCQGREDGSAYTSQPSPPLHFTQ